MKTSLVVTAACFCLVLGCGRHHSNAPAPKSAPEAPPVAVDDAVPDRALAGEFVVQKDEAQGAAKEAPKPAKVARKIKHSADLKLITEEFDNTRDALQKLIVKHDGYEAMADVRSSPGAQRLGTWRVRVPLENFAAFRTEVRELAEVESDTINTEDLTDQYYDLDANIKNLKAEQESWREMLKRTSDKLESFITVKRELDRVTDEIQRKEGRLRLMANLTDLTTVNITLRERQKFHPEQGPAIAEQASFGMRAEKTFDESWGALRALGERVALFGIAAAPWLPVILIVAGPVLWYVRRVHRAIPTATATPSGTA